MASCSNLDCIELHLYMFWSASFSCGTIRHIETWLHLISTWKILRFNSFQMCVWWSASACLYKSSLVQSKCCINDIMSGKSCSFLYTSYTVFKWCHFTLKMEAAWSSETLVPFHITALFISDIQVEHNLIIFFP